VRGAIDYARLVPELAELRAVPADDWHVGLDAALTTLSGRVRRHESCRRSADQVIEEIFRRIRATGPADGPPGGEDRPGGMTSPPAASAAGGRPQRPRPNSPKSGQPEGKTVGRRELSRHARFAEISPEVGVLDEQAMSRALAQDPAAFELLAAMTNATDERLRAAALRLGSAIVLERARAGRRVVILLSDCRSTDDDDTLEVARTLPELIILAPADDHEQAAQLADLAGARWAALADPLDAAAALDFLLEARITA
jgi:hypothetical protein